MGLYHESGYLNVPWIYRRGLPWQAITGGRGTGKTYGALKMCLDDKIRFIYLRRTQSQADIVSKPEFSPFKSLEAAGAPLVESKPITKYNAGFYMEDNLIGYSAALSTFANIRGFDASDVDLMIYDEFISERHERPIKHEFEALANAYETVNRNRELSGRPPLRILMLSNANDLGNPVFIGLDLVKRAVKMERSGTELFEDRDRGIGLYLLQRSPISDAKSQTALYKVTAGSSFAEMALDNQFTSSRSTTPIRSRRLHELTPICAIGNLCFYRVKIDGTIYASTHISGAPERFLMTDTDRERFRRLYAWLYMAYLDKLVECEDAIAESLLQKVFRS